MNSREVQAALTADGWEKVAQKDSHVQFKHPTKPGKVTVPIHPGDIPKRALQSIARQSGVRLMR